MPCVCCLGRGGEGGRTRAEQYLHHIHLLFVFCPSKTIFFGCALTDTTTNAYIYYVQLCSDTHPTPPTPDTPQDPIIPALTASDTQHSGQGKLGLQPEISLLSLMQPHPLLSSAGPPPWRISQRPTFLCSPITSTYHHQTGRPPLPGECHSALPLLSNH